MNDAELYQQNNHKQKIDVLYFLNKYTPRIKWKKDKNIILDIGSGDGSVTNILKTHIPAGYQYKVLGVDKSEKMVEHANNHHRDQRTSFKVLDITSIIEENLFGNFDHVFSFFTLHWVMDQKCAFTNIYNLLDCGGDCFVLFIAGAPVYNMFYIMEQNKKWSSLVTDVNQYISPYHHLQEPDKELRQIMENIGFINIEVECKDMAFVYEDIDMAKKGLKSICPFNIPQDLSVDFMNDYIIAANECGMMYTPGEGQPETVKMDYRLLIAYAQKPLQTVQDTKPKL